MCNIHALATIGLPPKSGQRGEAGILRRGAIAGYSRVAQGLR